MFKLPNLSFYGSLQETLFVMIQGAKLFLG